MIRRRRTIRSEASVWVALAGSFAVICAVSCTEPASETRETNEPSSVAATTSAAKASEKGIAPEVTASNLLESERYWPDIVALVEPWTPEAGATPLATGIRGALIRVEDDLRVRIAFGRHGDRAVPLAKTDLLTRANEIRRGERHKLGPNFIVHFGTQFVDPEPAELGPYPTLLLHDFELFLLVFADPRAPEFSAQVEALGPVESLEKVRSLFFPLGLEAGELRTVRDALAAADWLVPFAYPAAADVQARSLLADAAKPHAVLLVTAEGRLLLRATLDAPDLTERIRVAAGQRDGSPTNR